MLAQWAVPATDKSGHNASDQTSSKNKMACHSQASLTNEQVEKTKVRQQAHPDSSGAASINSSLCSFFSSSLSHKHTRKHTLANVPRRSFSPLMYKAVASCDRSLVTPKACHGSMEPLGNTTRVTLRPYPPYMVLVLLIPACMKSWVNFAP